MNHKDTCKSFSVYTVAIFLYLMAKERGKQRHKAKRYRTICSCRELYHWKNILCLVFIGLLMEVNISLKKAKDRKNVKAVPVENLDYFHAIACLGEVGHLQNSPKINEKVSRCICCIIDKMKSQIEYIEMIMKSLEYLYLLGHLPSCTIEVTILRGDIHEIILK